MSIRSWAFQLPMPGFVRRACIRRLAEITAEALGAPVPADRRTAEKTLQAFAAFSARQVQALLKSGRGLSAARERLFSGAFVLGTRLRRVLGIKSRKEAMRVTRALYRMIGVDFRPAPPNVSGTAFQIRRCFFAAHYSPAVCRLVSSLDAGLLCGLTDGGRMAFTQRITEGSSSCRGVVT
jgi:hypothetical protein